VLADAGVRYLNIHQTRHTYARRLRDRGVTLETRRVLMGHESIKTTEDQYGRETVDDAAVVIDEVW
jgi:integrase